MADFFGIGGAVVGGVFSSLWALLWWPWFFWSFAVAVFVLAGLSVLILPSVPVKPEIQKQDLMGKFHDLDLLGATVGITAMILFNFAWNQAPGFGWEKGYIYVLLIVGLLLFSVFFWIEIKVARKPLIPFDALSGDVSFVLGCVACGWAAFGSSHSHSHSPSFPSQSASPSPYYRVHTDNNQASGSTTSSNSYKPNARSPPSSASHKPPHSPSPAPSPP